jgi:hypothetical protein
MNGALVIAINRIFNTVGRIEQERCGLGIVTRPSLTFRARIYFFIYKECNDACI